MGRELKRKQTFYVLDPQDICFALVGSLEEGETALFVILKSFNQGRARLGLQIKTMIENSELSHGKLT
jgi:hypothetical protein